ncbi:aminopeptidase [Polaribacter undariae]|uniref:Aminopeptidase n=1 Tax=Polaribacter sejongensis TaxID=985043 RepID=A0AAJ1QWA2_9FLAO|nr:aminopeptidase [Polaribacter undariae]MDN3619356.1 aminopeptidase [Polaribacter undariae]UWD33444.1 aminopeptidase [Polaribacter undariae]
MFSQQNSISIKSKLDTEKDELKIQQEIVFHNPSDSILTKVYLHNWANSYRDRKTPLSKRFIKDFRKDLYFAKPQELGSSTIKSLSVDFENVYFKELDKQADIIEIDLDKPLYPNSKITISITYIVKTPNARFTKYGKTKTGYHLRNWYLTPAIYDNGWQLMSNLNLDDLYEKGTDFKIEIDVPKDLIVESNLYQYKTKKENINSYYLVGKNKTDVILGINKTQQLKTYNTKTVTVHTDVFSKELDYNLTTSILNREILFIQKYLGKYPHVEIFIDKATQSKNPIYGLNQLPNFLRPFSDTFKWDVTMFKALTKRYIENTLLLNKRKDYWLIDGIQNYLMIEYVEEYYPEVKLLGKVSNSWLVKGFNISKLDFNDKYPFVYQFTARKFLDQALNTSADSLSNFNRKIVSKYKAGLGFRFLKGYLGDSILNQTIQEFYQDNQLKITSSNHFNKLLSTKTTKDLDWFFNDFIKTNKKIDHKIESVKKEKDSISVTIKNKRNITTPLALYAIKDEEIKLKKWVADVDSTKTVKFKKGDYDTFVLNYENLYPELNTLNNWKTVDKKILNKPLKFSFLKDISSPNYNQVFYQPDVNYNFYNGLILGVKLHNKPLIKRNFEFKIAPYYATKSNTVIGSFSLLYNQFFEKTKIYKVAYGLAGGTSDYAPNLSYKSLTPYVDITFKRKTLRDISSEYLRAKLIHIDKEIAPDAIRTDQDNYSVLSLSYNYSNPDIIKEFRYSFSTEFAKKFSKATLDLRFRTLTTTDTQLDFRFFAGVFFNNKTEGDYFSFGLDRSNDYLFQLNYLGRSESSGFFSQQYIINEGGFKSVLPTRFANQFMVSNNSSIGLWRWIEVYNDVAFLKNKNQPLYFAYENGIRFNFVHEIFEIYFPLYSNNGWEISQNAYPEKIRFSLSADVKSIYNFFKRGFL